MSADSRRLSILTAREIDDLYGLPRFSEDDRLLYFDLSPAERQAVDGVHTPLSHISLLPFKHVVPNGTYFIEDVWQG